MPLGGRLRRVKRAYCPTVTGLSSTLWSLDEAASGFYAVHGFVLALTRSILGPANPRSTAIYPHVQYDPSRRAADRVTKRIADAVAGKT